MAKNNRISDQLLAAYLDGKTSPEETLRVLEALKTDRELCEALGIALAVDDRTTYDILPMMQLAAQNQDNICSVLCEAFILHRRDVPFSEKELLDMARASNWLKPQGAPIHSAAFSRPIHPIWPVCARTARWLPTDGLTGATRFISPLTRCAAVCRIMRSLCLVLTRSG